MVYRCIDFIQSILTPAHCSLCADPTPRGQQICAACREELPHNIHPCRRCAQPLAGLAKEELCGPCLRQAPVYDHCIAPFLFTSPIKELINGFKFQARLANGRLLSTLLQEYIETVEATLPDRLIPVPLHASRLRARGYNQALEIARPLARHFDLKLDWQLCHRIRNTPAQSGLDRNMRRMNLRGAFALDSVCAGESVTLIDDVVTTGSTVTELARVLKQGGARRVDVWCLARTAPTQDNR